MSWLTTIANPTTLMYKIDRPLGIPYQRVCLLACWALDSEASVSWTLALCSDWDVGFFPSLFLCLHCVLGGLGVLDQGADSTLRDPEVQVLLLLLFFPSHFGTGFSNKPVFATFCLGGAFTLPQGRKEVPNIIFSLYAKCMICRNGIHTHTHTPSTRPSANPWWLAGNEVSLSPYWCSMDPL